MRAFRPSLLLFIGLTACGITRTGNPATDHPEGTVLVQSHVAFDIKATTTSLENDAFSRSTRQLAFRLFTQLRASDDESTNLILAPYDVTRGLAMLYAGAAGGTRDELAGLLAPELSDEALHRAFGATEQVLRSRASSLSPRTSVADGFRLSRTGGVFVRAEPPFSKTLLNTLALRYDAGLFQVDATTEPKQLRVSVNRWFAAHTDQNVSDLLPDNVLEADGTIVWANASSFRGSWLTPFDAARTVAGSFEAPSGPVDVSFMHGRTDRYAQFDDYEAVAVSLASPSVAALVVLPSAGMMEQVEARVAEVFDEIPSALRAYDVDLQLPKFAIATRVDLTQSLRALGQESMFSSATGDFSGFGSTAQRLYVQRMQHAAFVAVDENGVEAIAAVTQPGSAVGVRPRTTVSVSRPFLFFIHDTETQEILFLGRVVDPSR